MAAGVFVAVLAIAFEVTILQLQTRSQVEDALGELPWHLVGFGTGSEYATLLDEVSAHQFVKDAEVVGTSTVPVTLVTSGSNTTLILNFVRDEFLASSSKFGILGLQTDSVGISVPQSLRESLGLVEGGQVSLLRTYFESDRNGTVVERRAWFNATISGFFEVSDSSAFRSGFGSDNAFLDFKSLDLALAALDLPLQGLDLKVYVELVVPSVVDPFDASLTSDNLDRVRRALEISTLQFGTSFVPFVRGGTDVSSILQRHYAELATNRLTTLALVLPLVVLGVYASFLGSEIVVRSRVPENATVLSRGLSRRGLFWVSLAETTLQGGIAGLLGFVVASLLVASFSGIGTLTTSVSVESLAGFDSTGMAIFPFLGIALLLVAVVIPVNRLRGHPIAGMLRGVEPLEPVRRRSGLLDGLAISLATFVLLLALVFPSLGLRTPSVARFLGSDFLAAFLPYAPVLLAVSLVRLALLDAQRPIMFFSRPFERFAGPLREVMRAMLRQDAARTAQVATVGALALALAIFASVGFVSMQAYQDNLVKAFVGSDIRIYSPSLDDDLVSQVLSHPSIAAACKGSWYLGQEAIVVSLDPQQYLNCVGSVDPYFDAQSKISAEAQRLQAGEAYVNLPLARSLDVARDSDVGIRLVNSTGSHVLLSLHVVGTVKALPGLEPIAYGDQIEEMGSEPMVYVSSSSVPNSTDLSKRADYLLVRVGRGNDASAVVEDLGILMPRGSVVLSASGLRESLASDPFFRGRASLLSSQVFLAVLVGGIETVLMIHLVFLTRTRDSSAIVARGATRGAVARMSLLATLSLLLAITIFGFLGGALASAVHFEILRVNWASALAPEASFSTEVLQAMASLMAIALTGTLWASARLLKISPYLGRIKE